MTKGRIAIFALTTALVALSGIPEPASADVSSNLRCSIPTAAGPAGGLAACQVVCPGITVDVESGALMSINGADTEPARFFTTRGRINGVGGYGEVSIFNPQTNACALCGFDSPTIGSDAKRIKDQRK